jgi:hypothetical protein
MDILVTEHCSESCISGRKLERRPKTILPGTGIANTSAIFLYKIGSGTRSDPKFGW